eukprot:TRINITY_DN21497_c0_g1_i1.p1 TRINITY_DN21497_c0_g1~~TRINITY_DN21497_c0_g1_i1.p1  ORF type:complete len:131 (+),score=11.66 TRINITY_DN21497_c0_g1_i1:38-430(+)
MGVEKSNLLVVVTLLGLLSVGVAIPGTATFYGPPYVPSSCYGFEDRGVMVAAASDVIWDNRAACGRRYSVTCTGRTNEGVLQPCRGTSVIVTVVDYCPPGCRGTIDLSQDAFIQIADTNAGVINIDYTPI